MTRRALIAAAILAASCASDPERAAPQVEIDELRSTYDGVGGNFHMKSGTAERFIVERRRAGASEFKTLDVKLYSGVFRFLDKTVEPDTTYDYRIAAAVDDVTPSWSLPRQIRTIDLVSWEAGGILSGVDGNCKVSFKITKYEPRLLKSFTINVMHVAGERIGSHTLAGEPTTFWKCRNGEETVSIDFDTHRILADARSGLCRAFRYRECLVADGGCQGCRIREKAYQGSRIVIEGVDGRREETWRPVWPQIEDKLCPEHADLKGNPFDDAPKNP